MTDIMIDPDLKQFIRKFSTGATRDTDQGKHDPEGFLSPLVIDRFNEYMHTNRIQKDGSIRDSDNWQKGIPVKVYMKSLWRHMLDVWLSVRGRADKMRGSENIEDALCGVIFNSMGMLHEVLLEKKPHATKKRQEPDQFVRGQGEIHLACRGIE